MALISIGDLTSFPSGEVREVLHSGEPFAICNVDGELHAVRGVCPHQGGPLGQGALHGKMLVCPWHAWEFDCVSGQNDYDADVILEKIAVVVKGNDVSLDLP